MYLESRYCVVGVMQKDICEKCLKHETCEDVKRLLSSFTDKLLVKEGWDESYEGQPEGDSTTDPLHYEGRAAKLAVVSGDSAKIDMLAKYAVCSGADYVEHRGGWGIPIISLNA